MFSPRQANSQEWFRAGFFASLGVSVLALLAWLLWQFATAALAICAPFVVGLMLALLLDPAADRLQRRGLPRLAAAGIVFLLFLFFLIGPGYLLVTNVASQIGPLGSTLSQALDDLAHLADGFLKAHHKLLGVQMPKTADKLTAQIMAQGGAYFSQSIGGVQGFLQGTVGAIISLVITLIVTFFLLKDIDSLRARFFYLLPNRSRAPMEQVGKDIGGVFYDYLRGLLIVCTLYGVCTVLMLYGLSLTPHHGALAGYALLVGTAAGVFYSIPYIGSTTTALITFLVAFAAGAPHGVSFGLWAIFATLILNQIFDNIITPRVVGGGVGLHPVAAIFALIVGAELFHLWGMLLSVPVAASIQVILFRVFPRLTEATPVPFLRRQGVPERDIQSRDSESKVAEGDHPEMPEGPSELREAARREPASVPDP